MILYRALYRIVHCAQVAHGLFRLHPRATALAPARTIEESYFDVKFGSGLEHGVQNLPPFVGKHFHGAGRSALALTDHAYLYTVDAGLLHGMEVLHHSFFRNVTAHPIPVYGKRLVFRRFDKCLLHLIEALSHDFLSGKESGHDR